MDIGGHMVASATLAFFYILLVTGRVEDSMSAGYIHKE